MNQPINIAILGASGYTGAELIRLLLPHPHVRIVALSGDSQAGKPLGEVYPHLAQSKLPDLVRGEAIDYSRVDLVFCCLPHGTTQNVIAALPEHVRVIDLSADFRLRDEASYAEWYGHPHQAVALQREAVYGLTEWARGAVAKARLVANPGCYPTASLLPLLPLIKNSLIDPASLIIDAKSGLSGAGRAAKQSNLFAEIDGGISAYGLAGHRHVPEIEQELTIAAEQKVPVTFTPHLVPMSRGMLATIYAALAPGKTASDARAALEDAYASETFVHVLPEGKTPATHSVRGTNQCLISVNADRVPGRIILVSAIDNLVKGASGQAVQNMNVMHGWPETLGLEHTALFP